MIHIYRINDKWSIVRYSRYYDCDIDECEYFIIYNCKNNNITFDEINIYMQNIKNELTELEIFIKKNNITVDIKNMPTIMSVKNIY